MTGNGTWLKTLDGRDVYTEDGEWFFFHAEQAWFHEPGLLTAPPAPPLSVRARDEYTRLTTNWPGPLKAFDIGRLWGFDRFLGIMCVSIMTYLWVWKVAICDGPAATAVAWARGWRNLWHEVSGEYMTPTGWLMTDNDTRILVTTVLFTVITFICWYGLYVGHLMTVDTHKGWALVGAVLAVNAYSSHKRHDRDRERRIAHDVASELRRRTGGIR